VQLTTCSDDAEQNWTVAAGGAVQINGVCLDTAGGGTSPGTAVVVNTCTSGGTQVWTQGTGNTLVNQASGLCLDDPGTSTTNNTQLDVQTCDGGIEQVWPLPAAPASPTTPPAGQVYPSEEQHNGDVPCLDNTASAATAGAKVVLERCTGTKAQQWTAEPDGTLQSYGMCLDTQSGGTFQGALTVLNTCNGSGTQAWTPEPNGSLVNQGSGLCLDDPGLNTNNGVQMQIYSCNGGPNQHWWLPEN
jgi:hypothetical protein